MADPREFNVLAEVPRSGGREVYRVAKETRRGYTSLDLRIWYTAATGDLRPTSHGLTVKVHHLDALIAALHAARLKMTGGGAL